MKNKLLILMALFIALPTFTTAQKWEKYKSKEGKFELEIPGEPKEEIDKQEDAKTIQIELSVNDVIYMASAVIHKTNLKVDGITPEMLAESSLDAFANVIGGEIVSKKDFKINKVTGKSCVIKNDSKGFECYYRCIVVGQIQYQFIVMNAPSKSDKSARIKFIDSIKIK